MARFFLLEHSLQVFVFYHGLIPRRFERYLYLDMSIGNDFENRVPDHILEHIRHRTERGCECHEYADKFFFLRKSDIVDQS